MKNIQIERLGVIIKSDLSSSLGENIQGPSLTRVPKWIKHKLGKYYLYLLYTVKGEQGIAIANMSGL